jgi:hypothetical protein
VTGIMIFIAVIHTTRVQLNVLRAIGKLHMNIYGAIEFNCGADGQNEDSKSPTVRCVLKGCRGEIRHSFIGMIQPQNLEVYLKLSVDWHVI